MKNRRRFTLFHLSLVQLRQLNFETLKLDREGWLRHLLSRSFQFAHRSGTELYWVPKENIGSLIFGVIQQQRPHQHHQPPELGGDETASSVWQGAYVLLDPTTHETGQRVAVENDVVGAPNALLTSLFDYANDLAERPYNIEFDQLFDGGDFWRFAERHKRILKTIIFDFVVPNMWNTESNLEQDLKDTRRDTGAEKVKVQLDGREGIKTESQKVKDGVNYAEKGAGAITARAFDGAVFSSRRRPKRVEVPRDTGSDEATRESIAKFSETILGRDGNVLD